MIEDPHEDLAFNGPLDLIIINNKIWLADCAFIQWSSRTANIESMSTFYVCFNTHHFDDRSARDDDSWKPYSRLNGTLLITNELHFDSTDPSSATANKFQNQSLYNHIAFPRQYFSDCTLNDHTFCSQSMRVCQCGMDASPYRVYAFWHREGHSHAIMPWSRHCEPSALTYVHTFVSCAIRHRAPETLT